MDWLSQLFGWLNSLFAPQRYIVQYAQTPYGVAMPKPSIPSRTSSAGISFIKRKEGFRPNAYWDVKQWAIGYGHKIIPGDGLTKSSVITEDQAAQLLMNDLVERENTVKNSVRVPLTQNQFDALVSLVYNIGSGNFAKSDVLKHLNMKRYDLARASFAQFNTAGGKPVLAQRRAEEAAMFGSA